MSQMKRNAVQGFYKEHFCRSLHEFHACLYFEFVKQQSFVMEPFAMISEINGKKKIPDLAVIDHEKKTLKIIEIKQTNDELADLFIYYSENKFRCPPKISEYIKSIDYSIDFEFYSNCKKHLKPKIILVLGKDKYHQLLNEYKSQRKTYTGFPGSLNPNFGKHLSFDTKIKQSNTIAKNGGRSGKLNSNFGNHLSDNSKKNVGAKWHTLDTKNNILRTSLLNRLEILTDTQYNEFIQYCIKSLSGIKINRPLFMNGIVKVTKEKVIEIFGSYSNFWNFVNLGVE